MKIVIYGARDNTGKPIAAESAWRGNGGVPTGRGLELVRAAGAEAQR